MVEWSAKYGSGPQRSRSTRRDSGGSDEVESSIRRRGKASLASGHFEALLGLLRAIFGRPGLFPPRSPPFVKCPSPCDTRNGKTPGRPRRRVREAFPVRGSVSARSDSSYAPGRWFGRPDAQKCEAKLRRGSPLRASGPGLEVSLGDFL